MNEKRVLLFTMGNWSHSNDAIVKALEHNRPNWKIRVVDLLMQLKRDKRLLLACGLDVPMLLWQALLEHGFDKNNVLYAPTTSRFINRVAREFVREHKPDFTLQTTTRFNAVSDEVPHFTIVDITMAAARPYYRDTYHSSARSLDMMHAFQQHIYSSSTGVFAMGRYVRDSLIKDYRIAPHRAHAMGAGPNIEIGARSSIAGSHNILFVGTNWVRKGGPSLLAAFRLVRDRYPQARLYIVGCNPNIDEPGVVVVGRVVPEDLPPYFTGARIFALPTEFEAFGIVFAEALHYGLPILSSNIGAIPEMVEDGINGHLVQPGDVESIARHLDALLSNDELARRFGTASHLRAPQFTWERAGAILSEKILQLSQPHSMPRAIGSHHRLDRRVAERTSHHHARPAGHGHAQYSSYQAGLEPLKSRTPSQP